MIAPTAGLSAEVERLLLDVVADGFVLYCCGPKAQPTALVAAYEWDQWVDLATIRDFAQIVTARMPKREKMDMFAPEVVVWAYQGPARWALRALLNLVHPQHPDAPAFEFPAPRALRVPQAEQRPLTIRLPSPGKAGMRAARLAATLPGMSGSR